MPPLPQQLWEQLRLLLGKRIQTATSRTPPNPPNRAGAPNSASPPHPASGRARWRRARRCPIPKSQTSPRGQARTALSCVPVPPLTPTAPGAREGAATHPPADGGGAGAGRSGPGGSPGRFSSPLRFCQTSPRPSQCLEKG